MMRKLFIVLLVGLSLFCLTVTACKQQSQEATPPAESTATPPAAPSAPGEQPAPMEEQAPAQGQ
ncbi:MAG TPA: hypothetical protein PKJ77_10140 [Thermodesulfobacteriota bacterium]|nr:hypothetical protein [Thermodesulfobacteriota bacterium]HOC39625.1 hypothetical protein [Thermodesulfobacteriota bacterium]